MYQVSDVARLFGVSDTTIRNWVGKGKLKCRRLHSLEFVYLKKKMSIEHIRNILTAQREAMIMWKM